MFKRLSHKSIEARSFRAAGDEAVSPKGRERSFEVIAAEVSPQAGMAALFPEREKKAIFSTFRASARKMLSSATGTVGKRPLVAAAATHAKLAAG